LRKIYLTHCTGIKDDSYEFSDTLLYPPQLYRASPTQRFIACCKKKEVPWAILSDQYGIWFPGIKRKWYDKHPDTVTEAQFAQLLSDFDKNLKDFSEIWFYNNPSWFHPLYQRIISQSTLNSRINTFSHLKEISNDTGRI